VFTLIGLLVASAHASDLIQGDKIEAPSASTNSVSAPTNSQGGTPDPITSSSGGKYLPVSFARLSSFTFKPAQAASEQDSADSASAERNSPQLPNTVRILADKQVAVTGFMLPTQVVEGRAVEFLLLKNQSACCYGVMPRVNEWVVVRTSGKGVKPLMDVPVTALGTLHVGELRNNGQLSGIYQLDLDELVKPKQ
jgi:hypothetical protein